MNKIKEELRQKLQGQLSDYNTQLDVDNAYSVVKKSVLSFSSFLCRKFEILGVDGQHFTDIAGNVYSLDEIFKMWKNGKYN